MLRSHPQLKQNEVHVWLIQTRQANAPLARVTVCLSDAERDRANRFKFDVDRERYIVSHTAMRSILARYLGCDPSEIAYAIGAHGKPELAPASRILQLEFNLSHSNDAALVAVAPGRAVGVDIEHIQQKLGWQEIADRFFAPGEIQKLHALPSGEQLRAFFTCWTRKEAYIKAKGGGLSIPLQEFEVSLARDEDPAILWHAEGAQETQPWQFGAIDSPAGYVASIAVEGGGSVVRQFCWADDAAQRIA
jgi:4'-phosphopantetheinyl transferase